MIPNQWYVVLESREVKPGKLLGVTRMGEKLLFARDSLGKAFCLRDRCAHRGAALSLGRLAGDCVECPFHGFQYDASGRGRCIPANGREAPVPERFRVDSLPTFEKHGFVWIWLGEAQPVDEPFFFDDIDPSFSWCTTVDPWDAHYSRVIENQLDVVHLPFVHHNTIGRGNRTLVNGPVIERDSLDGFSVRPFNAADTGQVPLRAEEIKPPYPSCHLQFHFPNIWQNWISESMRIVAAFVPVDDAHTLLYLRFYQRFLRVPLLRDGVNAVFTAFNRIVAHQDRRVVVTQTPKASGLGPQSPGLGENLVQGDGPVAFYRMRRQELMEIAAGKARARGTARAPRPRRG